LYWRANPIGKVRQNLPFYQHFAHKEFTQKI
jgi:hypothetical protein